MDNMDKKLKEFEDKITKLRQQGKKKVEWRLTRKQKECVEQIVGDENIIPRIYEIRVKTFKNISNIQSSIIREVHYAKKAGKKTIGKSLKRQEEEDLKKYDVKYSPIKYVIYLN